MRKSLTFLCIGVALSGCGGSLTANSASHSYLGTQGPGDVWAWDLTGATYTATNQTLNHHYSGTKAVLPTGFLKLTVQNTDDPNVTVGQSAYALELPGTALILKMAGDDTKAPIIASSLGSDPTGPQVTFNFVAVGSQNFQPATDQAFSNVTLGVAGNIYSGVTHRWAVDGSPLANGAADFSASNGLMTDLIGINGVFGTGAMTPSGVCVLDYGPNNGGAIGVLQPAANVNLADLATRHFRGFMINQGKTQCVTVTPNGDGTLHGAGYQLPSGVETGTLDNGGGPTVSFTGQPNPGEVTINIAYGGGASDNLVAAINRVSGKYMLFCFAVGQGGTPYNVVLVEN